MSLRYMSDGEIAASYRQAADKKEQVRILAQLNCMEPEEIREILRRTGADKADEKPKKKEKRTHTVAAPWTEAEIMAALSMRRAGASNSEIGARLGRTKASVQWMFTKCRKRGMQIERGRYKRKL